MGGKKEAEAWAQRKKKEEDAKRAAKRAKEDEERQKRQAAERAALAAMRESETVRSPMGQGQGLACDAPLVVPCRAPGRCPTTAEAVDSNGNWNLAGERKKKKRPVCEQVMRSC